MYRQIEFEGKLVNVVERLSDNANIPFDPANIDYQKFKKDVLEKAELQDADGNVMPQEEAVAFINELP